MQELVRRLHSRQQEVAKQDLSKKLAITTPVNDVTLSSVSEGPLKIKYSEGSEYVATMKILKRPEKKEEQSSSVGKTGQSQKSLAEREAEYASARARILGDNSSSSTNSKTSDINLLRHPQGPSERKGFQRDLSSK